MIPTDSYPPNPPSVPAGLTKPTSLYRFQALLVVATLFLFVLVYLCLTFGLAALSIWSFCEVPNVPMPRGRAGGGVMLMLMLALFGIVTGLFSLYFFKGLFKSPRGGAERYRRITEEEEPQFFAFIRRVCAEAGAPAPAEIVISHEVNASVYYTCSFWSLFLPLKKKLHIGLGLVNSLNLSEFKAVLAHEFGHFSQRSMRLGSYVYTANRVIQEVIYGRDAFDQAVSFLDPVLNGVRWVLARIFRVINFAHAGLQRHMEFQADLVAVSLTGSDAIINALKKIDFAQQCLDQTTQDLTAAGDHGVFSTDLFHHQTKAADYLRILKQDDSLGVPPRPTESGVPMQVFEPNEAVLPPMWASHPPHYEREKNCKRIYLAGSEDDRPAWTLFKNQLALREEITRRSYEQTRPPETIKPRPAEAVQAFIDDDRAETVYAARYDGMYEDGLIAPGPIDSLWKTIPGKYEQPTKLHREHSDIFSPDLRRRLEAYRERRRDQQRLGRFAQKIEVPRRGRFDFRGQQHNLAAVPKLLEQLEDEVKADHNHLSGLDRRIFLVYMGMARQLDDATAKDLEQRYRFHLAVQDMILELTACSRLVQQTFDAAAATPKPTPEAIQDVGLALRKAQDALGKHMVLASSLRLPRLRNMQAGMPLSHFLDARPVVHDLFGSQQIMDGSWLKQVLGRHAEIIDKLRRILFKSLGALLCTQERVGERWKAKYAPRKPDPDEAAASAFPTTDGPRLERAIAATVDLAQNA